MKEACVLITVYNGAPWIDEALDSALGQRDVDFEILVIDDGSTDDTPSILARRAAARPDRIRVITTPNAGLSSARNLGFDAADAEFVTCLDADDRMHPLRVRLECDALLHHPDAVLSFAGRWNFEDGEERGWMSFVPDRLADPGDALFTRHDDPLSAMLEAGEYPGTDACTCRASWAREHGRFDPELRVFVDGERWVRCLRDTPVVYVACPLYERRVHAGAMSAEFSRNSAAIFGVLDSVRAEIDQFTPRQRANLFAFEKQAGVWLGRRAGLAGERPAARAFLWRHRNRLMSGFWARTMLFLVAPPGLRATWRRLTGKDQSAAAQHVLRQEIANDDPTAFWSVALPSPSTPEEHS